VEDLAKCGRRVEQLERSGAAKQRAIVAIAAQNHKEALALDSTHVPSGPVH